MISNLIHRIIDTVDTWWKSIRTTKVDISQSIII